MSDAQSTLDPGTLRTTLLTWLKPRLDDESYDWLASAASRIAEGDGEDWEFFTSFSAVPRHTGKELLQPDENEMDQAAQLRQGWNPGAWSLDQTGRTLLILSLAERGREEFLDKLEKSFISSDMGEAVALYQSLPLLPWPKDLTQRAAEGIRSNITTVFNVIALNNPYPADYLEEGPWNQMVLKALFVDAPLYPIQGIDRRANPTLAKMLVEYAHERWSAGRTVSPELWRPTGPFLTDLYLEDLEKVLSSPDAIQRQAAILTLKMSSNPKAGKILNEHTDMLKEVESEAIGWETIGRKWEAMKTG